MPRTRLTCRFCNTAAKAGARCFHAGDRTPSRGSVLVGNPDGTGFSLVWYDRTFKMWAHSLHDAKGSQIGPGEKGSCDWFCDQKGAVQAALDYLSATITGRLGALQAARDTRKAESAVEQFRSDMERAGFTVEPWPNVSGEPLPSVQCCMGSDPYSHLGYDHPDVQEVVRATRVRLQWSSSGGMVVALPAV